MGKKLILGRLTEKNSHIDHPGFVLHKVNERIVRLLRWDSCHHAQKRAGTLWRPILCCGSAQIGLEKKIFSWKKKLKLGLKKKKHFSCFLLHHWKKIMSYTEILMRKVDIHIFFSLIMKINNKHVLSNWIMKKAKNVTKNLTWISKKSHSVLSSLFLDGIILGQKPSELVFDLFCKMSLFHWMNYVLWWIFDEKRRFVKPKSLSEMSKK